MRTNNPIARRVLGAVRESTASLHQQLDDHVQGHRMLAGEANRPHYLRMLRAHWSLHCLVAQHTGQVAHDQTLDLLDWPECERLVALSSDLEALGDAADNRPKVAPTTVNEGAAFCAGLIYVVEGACHGNGQMLKALSKNPEFVSWGAHQFMQLSYASIGNRWPRALKLLCCQGDDHLDQVIRGAVDGFEFFKTSWDRDGEQRLH